MQSKNFHVTFYLFCCALLFVALTAACGPAASDSDVVPTAAAVDEQAAPALNEAPVETQVEPPADLPTVPAAVPESYPAPEVIVESAYPGAGEVVVPAGDAMAEPYPPPVTEEVFLEPRFRFDQPLTANAISVTGQAPPDLAVAILDVTYNGAVLGQGRTDANGRFTITVSPLIEGNRIGITVGELQPNQSLNQMAEQYYPYRGDGFMNVPNVGILFDTVLVQP